jgi:Thioredoxin-like
MAFNRKNIFLWAALCPFAMNAGAHTAVSHPAAKPAKFIIQFEKELQYRRNEKLQVRLWSDFITWRTWPKPQLVSSENNRFTFEIPPFTTIGRVFIGIPSLRGQDVLNWQIVEPGDSVCINISSDDDVNMQYSITGRGVEKYRYAMDVWWNDTGQLIKNVMGKETNPYRKKALLDSLLQKKLGSLAAWKNISPSVKKILAWEVQGNLYKEFVQQLYFAYRDSAINQADIIRIIDQLPEAINLQDSLFLKAGSYIEYLYGKEKLKLVCRLGDYWTDKAMGFQLTDLYNAIRNKYRGMVREKLLSYTLIDPFDVSNFFGGTGTDSYAKCLQDAWSLIKTPFLKEAMRQQMQPYRPGAKVFDFAMPDTAGRIVNLHDFKGKVVLIDVWGDRCAACLRFRRMFTKEVYPSLQADTGFVLLSVSADTKMAVWKNAISLDGYNRPGYVNVGSPGIGFNHPFFTYYKVFLIPYLMLVDRNGDLVACDIPASVKADTLLDLINKTLSK